MVQHSQPQAGWVLTSLHMLKCCQSTMLVCLWLIATSFKRLGAIAGLSNSIYKIGKRRYLMQKTDELLSNEPAALQCTTWHTG